MERTNRLILMEELQIDDATLRQIEDTPDVKRVIIKQIFNQLLSHDEKGHLFVASGLSAIDEHGEPELRDLETIQPDELSKGLMRIFVALQHEQIVLLVKGAKHKYRESTWRTTCSGEYLFDHSTTRAMQLESGSGISVQSFNGEPYFYANVNGVPIHSQTLEIQDRLCYFESLASVEYLVREIRKRYDSWWVDWLAPVVTSAMQLDENDGDGLNHE